MNEEKKGFVLTIGLSVLLEVICALYIFKFKCGLYLIELLFWGKYYSFSPEEIIFLLLAVGLVIFKKRLRIVNIIISSIFLILYSYRFFDLLIIKGFIDGWYNRPFIIMEITMDLPIILANIIIIYLLMHSLKVEKLKRTLTLK